MAPTPPSPLPGLGSRVIVTLDTNQLHGDVPQLVRRSAEVVIAWPGEPWKCNVVVTLDGPNDTPLSQHRQGAPCHRWLGGVPYDPTSEKVPSWCWPL
jgi:hypothetical protein